ncbi:MAG: hypothetical protein NC201_06205 [Prevotella sp.]|nr:hypothetical protein [Bacteroides sp.]MCM1366823.1 hypothetical protein [Prevotella sp.]MCM1437404.1 hypothetical protein [Prevotella sp.]
MKTAMRIISNVFSVNESTEKSDTRSSRYNGGLLILYAMGALLLALQIRSML